MEDNRQTSFSGDMFSFPVMIPDQFVHSSAFSDQFEFDCVTTPGSPKSPADHLFFNGKLLPHVFPIQPANSYSYNAPYSRSTSRTSSNISSGKDSLMSSRSNSTNSRSSNCVSARNSTSDPGSGELRKAAMARRRERNKGVANAQCQNNWQFMAAAPVLRHQGSRSRKGADRVNLEGKAARKSRMRDEESSSGGAKSSFGSRVLKSLVSACKECHSMKETEDDHMEDDD